MLERRTLSRITAYVVVASALLALLAFVLGGPVTGIGAVVGGALGVANWMLTQWVGRRILRANERGRAVWGTLLALKMALSLAVVWLVLSTGLVDPIGFVVGLSGLILGVLAGAFHAALAPAAEPVEEG